MAEGARKRVLISGAGVAGISCAVLLDPEKYEISIVEQTAEFRNLGFSIVLWKSGFSLLMELLEKHGVRTEEGRDYFKVDSFKLFAGDTPHMIREFDSRGFGWAFKRARLMEILEGVVRTRIPQEHIRFSRAIRHIEYEREGSPARVTFRDGTQELYDIVVIAEGVHSSSRELIGVQERIVSEPYALRYAWFTSPTALGSSAGLFLTRGQVAVVHPPSDSNLLGFYFDKGTPESEQRSFESLVQKCIKQPDGRDSVLDLKTSDIFELKEVHLDSYASRNAVVIGDAAHGRPPTLGFGTSLAIEDATLLSRMLNSLESVSSDDVSRALQSYSGERIPRVEEVYSLQDRIQMFYTKSAIKVRLMTLFMEMFLGEYFETRMKALASFKI